MTIQDADLLSRLHAADLTVDDLFRKAMRIRDRVSRLGEAQRSGKPPFSGPWTKEAIQVHIERVAEWVRTPTRAANRQRLEALGVRGAAVKPEALDNSEFLDEVLREVDEIIAACPALKESLLADDRLAAWLSAGTEEARAKLSALKEGIGGCKRINDAKIASEHRKELLAGCTSDPERVSDCQKVAKQVESVLEYNITISADAGVSAQEAMLRSLSESLLLLQSRFPERLEALRPSLDSQPAAEAEKLVTAEVGRSENEYAELLAEWERLQKTLRLLGGEDPVSSTPRTLGGLREQISEFRKQCSTKVGEEGMKLLVFLQGDSDFPAGLTLEAVRDALLSLRPLIAISSKAGVEDAESG